MVLIDIPVLEEAESLLYWTDNYLLDCFVHKQKVAENMLLVVLDIHYSLEVPVLEVHRNLAAVDHIQLREDFLLVLIPDHVVGQMFQVVEVDCN